MMINHGLILGMVTVQFKPIAYEVHNYECMYANNRLGTKPGRSPGEVPQFIHNIAIPLIITKLPITAAIIANS